MSDFSSAIGELDRDIAKQTQLRDALKAIQAKGGLERAHEESQQRLTASRGDEEVVQADLKAHRADLAKLKKTIVDHNQKASQILDEANLEAARIVSEAREQVTQERQVWTEKIKDLEHRVGSLEGDLSNKRVTLDELEARIASAKNEVKKILEGA